MLTEEEARIIQEAEDRKYRELMDAVEARQHAEQQLEHDLEQAARFLLAHESLPEIWVRMGNMAMAIDYGDKEEPF